MRTKLDLLLDRVEARKHEVTIDVDGCTPAERSQISAAARSRGLHVSGTSRWLLIRALGIFLVGCGSGGYAPGFEGDGGIEPAADSGIVPQGTGGAPAEAAPLSCGSGPHGQSSACRATGSPYEFACPSAPGLGCKMATVGSSTHMSVVYCCARPEYP